MTDIERKQIFAHNLSNYIELSGKSQKEIAKTLHISPQALNTWVKGKALPRMGKVQMLADYFMIEITDLLERHAETEPLTPTEHEIDLITKYRTVGKQAQRRIDRVIGMEYEDKKAGAENV